MPQVQLITINDVAVSLQHLLRVVVEKDNRRVLVFVKERTEPFAFHEESPEKAINLFVDLCKLLETTQQTVPFLFFANVAIQLQTLTAVHVDGCDVVVSSAGQAPDTFTFADAKTANQAFCDLMLSLGLGRQPEPTVSDNGGSIRGEKSRSPRLKKSTKRNPNPKPPDKSAKAGRA